MPLGGCHQNVANFNTHPNMLQERGFVPLEKQFRRRDGRDVAGITRSVKLACTDLPVRCAPSTFPCTAPSPGLTLLTPAFLLTAPAKVCCRARVSSYEGMRLDLASLLGLGSKAKAEKPKAPKRPKILL